MKKTLILLFALLLCCLVPSAFAQDVTVSGCAYMDVNGNAVADNDESRMSGVPVTLERPVEDGWETVQQAVTDEYGQYAFTGLGAGEYRLLSAVGDETIYAASIGDSRVVMDGSAMLVFSADAPVTADVGLREGVSLHVTVYEDTNANGEQGPYEEGVTGVKVELLDGDTVVASGTSHRKRGVTLLAAPGEYLVRVTLNDFYAFTTKGDDSIVEGEGGEAVSDLITLSAEGDNEEYVAVRSVGSFTGMAFEDVNNNGILDDGDEGVAGVTVYLVGQRTGTTREITTDETGVYNFVRLPADRYTVTASLPQGMLYARYSMEGGDLRSIFTGENLEREFSVKAGEATVSKNVGVIQQGGIKGLAFLDLNYNGMPDEGEPGYPGVTLEVLKHSDGESVSKAVSQEDGTFYLENLRSTTYRLRAILPVDGSRFTVTREGIISEANLFEQRSTRREYTVYPIVLVSGEEAYAVVGVARSATVSGTVFEDADYNGVLNGSEKKLSGIAVRAIDEDGEVAAEAVTGKNGVYTLKGLMPGSYIIQVQRKTGHGFTRLRPYEENGSHITVLEGRYGVTDPMEVAMDEEITGINAGMLPSATVSGVFFHDVNDNGQFDRNETGMMGAEVRLLSADGEIDLYVTPDEKGKFLFDGVMPGEYTVTYLLPEHTEMAKVVSGGNTVAHDGLATSLPPFTIEMGKDYKLEKAGAVTLGSFCGGVFNDLNANGRRDSGETMFGGTVLTAVSASGVEYTVTAESNGSFELAGLRPDDYTLTISLPDGYIFSHSLDEDALTLDAVREQTFACPWQVLINRNEKPIGAVIPAVIRGEIWMDENKNGTQESGEWIMEGLNLNLIDEATGLTAATVATNENGFVFDSVRPGTYTVHFDLPEQAIPADAPAATLLYNGSAMVQGGIAVEAGQQVSSLNAGLVSTTSIGGTALLEEGGERTPVAGVTVNLWQNGLFVASTVTDENGFYRFDGLWPDNYALSASVPEGIIFVRPNDPNYESGASIIASTEDGMSDTFFLYMAQHQLEKDILYMKAAKVGDLVWLDENQNGLVDAGEPLMPGVTVRLLQNGEVAYETVSNEYGYYFFGDVYPGEYMLEATAYPQLKPTTPVPALRLISSCLIGGDGASAYSDSFRVESGERNLNFDLGYVLLDGERIPEAILVEAPGRDWSLNNLMDPVEVW